MKMKHRKLLSILSAMTILVVGIMAAIPLSAMAEPAAEEIPFLTDVEGFNIWTNPANWNYTITENPWKFVRGANNGMTELRYDTNRYGDKAPITIDLNKTPAIAYDIEASGDFATKVSVADVGDIDILIGSGKGVYDLTKNADVMKAAKDGIITISTLKFEFTGSKEGSSMTVNALKAVPKAVEIPMLTDVEGFNIWTNPANWNYTITENPWKFVRGANNGMTELRYDTNRYGDKAPITIDLNKTPAIAYDIEASGDFATKVSVADVGDIDILIGSGKGVYDLTKNADVMKAAKDGIVTISTLKFEFTGSKEGSYMVINQLMVTGQGAEDKQDAEAAAAVDKLIADLGHANELTVDKKDAVKAAREAYEALNMNQKNMVTKLADLEAAEKVMEKLVYEDALDLKENHVLTDDKTGMKLEGTLPANGALAVEDKAGSGVASAAESFISDKELNNLLGCYGVSLKNGEDVVDRLDREAKLYFPVKGDTGAEKYAVMSYDPLADVFTEIPFVVENGFAVIEVNTNSLCDYVLVGNDAAKAAFDKADKDDGDTKPVDPSTPDTKPDVPATGSSLPVAAMVLAAVSAGYVFSRKKNK